jgi:hypothetical protein
MSAIITFVDIFHCTVFIWKHRPVYFSKYNVSETGFCLRLQVRPTQLGSIERTSHYFWRRSTILLREPLFAFANSQSGTFESMKIHYYWPAALFTGLHSLQTEESLESLRKICFDFETVSWSGLCSLWLYVQYLQIIVFLVVQCIKFCLCIVRSSETRIN